MKSAGNDIVALKAIDRQRTCRPEFYSKFITPSELAVYSPNSLSFENFVWLLWSVKESAYKYFKRNNAELVFSPAKNIIQSLEKVNSDQIIKFEWEGSRAAKFFKGSVLYNSNNLYFQAMLHPEFIATVVNDEADFKNVYCGVKLIDSSDSTTQSAGVRSFKLNQLGSLFPNDLLSIAKSPVGYPVLLNNGSEVDSCLSFAHHGHFVAYSFRN